MIKKILIALTLLASATQMQAQKFALIDLEYILSNIPAYERANEQLNQTSKAWQNEIEAISNEAATLYKNYQNESVFLSEAQKKEREQAIVDKEKEAADLKKKYFGPEGELFKKRQSLVAPIHDEIYNFLVLAKALTAMTPFSKSFLLSSVACILPLATCASAKTSCR